MKAFIFSASPTYYRWRSGYSKEKWLQWTNGLPRALLPLNGEDILGRLLRQLRDNGVADITLILDYKKEVILKKYNLPYISSHAHFEVLYSVSLTIPYWGDENLLLLGDFVFPDEVVREILEVRDDLTFFHRTCSEAIAVKFNSNGAKQILDKWSPQIDMHITDEEGRPLGNSSYKWTCERWCLGFLSDYLVPRGVGKRYIFKDFVNVDGSEQYYLIDIECPMAYAAAKQIVERDKHH